MHIYFSSPRIRLSASSCVRALSTVCVVAVLSACGTSTAPNQADRSVVVDANAPVPPGHYRVQRGDNLYRIGLRFGQSAATLARWNNLADPTQIEVGQVLRVRRNVSETATTTAGSDNNRYSGSASAASAARVGNLRLSWPVKGPILSAYNGQSNKGIDIGGSRGTEVKAVADGTVMYVGDGLRGYGKLILLRHNSATLTAYAHNDSLVVKKGEAVRREQTIATMGDSGTNQVKLHFELRINGKAVNPTPYLQD